MKRIFLLFCFAVFSAGLFAQHHSWKNPERRKVDFRDSTYFHIAPTIAAGQYIDADDQYVQLAPDTVQHTSNFTLASTDVDKDIYCLETTTACVITIPLSFTDMPIGSTLNFYGEGSGIMVFKAAAGVNLHSDTDSIASSRQHQVVGLKKRGNNYYILYGPLTD